jgi:hypothetical protein
VSKDLSFDELFSNLEKDNYSEILPFFPDDVSGIPNSILRSALFGIVKQGRKQILDAVSVPCLGNVEVIYTGKKLNQNDLDVWEMCIALASEKNSWTVDFERAAFLDLLGKTKGKASYEWLLETIDRLSIAHVKIKNGNYSYFGNLITSGYIDEGTGRYIIELNPLLSATFSRGGWTMIDMKKRSGLKGYLAQWLFCFYSTHREPYKLSVEKIYELCGSEARFMRSFKSKLIEALNSVEEATGWKCFINENSKVEVIKPEKKPPKQLL